MFDLKKKEPCQFTVQARQREDTVLFGPSYDYFDRRRALIQNDDCKVKDANRQHVDWASGEDEVFCNVNAFESDQLHSDTDFCHRQSKSFAPGKKSQCFNHQLTVQDQSSKISYKAKCPESSKSQPNRPSPENVHLRSPYLPVSTEVDHHTSPTIPDEGYSTGTNSTTSISSPLSESLASAAFFGTCHSQCLPNTLTDQQPISTAVNSNKPHYRDLPDSYIQGLNCGPDFARSVCKTYVLEDYKKRCIGEGITVFQQRSSPIHQIIPALTMQRAPIQKGPSLNHIGRKCLHTMSMPIMKRRDVPKGHEKNIVPVVTAVSSNDTAVVGNYNSCQSLSSLEDKIRALTTIEEEDVGTVDYLGHLTHQQLNRSPILHNNENLNKYREGQNVRQYKQLSSKHGSNPEQTHEDYKDTIQENTQYVETTGFFRAVPVQILQPEYNNTVTLNDNLYTKHLASKNDLGVEYGGQQNSNYQHNTTDTGSANSARSINGIGYRNISNKGSGLRNYQQLFEKDVDIPEHNIDPAFRDKCSNMFRTSHSHPKLKRDPGPLTFQMLFNNNETKMAHYRPDVFPEINQSEAKLCEQNAHIPSSIHSDALLVHSPKISSTGNNFRAQLTLDHLSHPNRSVPIDGDCPEYYNTASSVFDSRSQRNEFSSIHELSSSASSHVDPSLVCHLPDRDIINTEQQKQIIKNKQLSATEKCIAYQKEQLNPISEKKLETNSNYLNELDYQTEQQYRSINAATSSFYRDEEQLHPKPHCFQPPQGIAELQHIVGFGSQQSHGRHDYQSDTEPVQIRRLHVDNTAYTDTAHTDLYSWQRKNLTANQGISRQDETLQRNSLDLGNVPQLHNQIRASSELCLQTSRRHMFASSADIHKLFSSHRQRPCMPMVFACSAGVSKEKFDPTAIVSQQSHEDLEYQGGNISHRHSLHSTSNPFKGNLHQHYSSQNAKGFYYQQSFSQNHEPCKHQQATNPLPSTSVQDAPTAVSYFSQSQINIPHNFFANISNVQQLSNPPTKNIQSLHTNNLLGDFDQDLNLSSHAPTFQRQLSGYSSETELQQIEHNARLGKKNLHHCKKQKEENPVLPELGNPSQEFIALNRSADQDSTTTGATEESHSDAFVPTGDGQRRSHSAEPLYMNQIMLGWNEKETARITDYLPPPLPTRRFRPASIANDQCLSERPSHLEPNSCRKSRNVSLQVPISHVSAISSDDKDICLDYSLPESKNDQHEFLRQQINQSPDEFSQELLQHSSNSEIFNKYEKRSKNIDTPVFMQYQLIHLQTPPVTITSHVPNNSLTQESQTSNCDINRQLIHNRQQNVNPLHNISDKIEHSDKNYRQKEQKEPTCTPAPRKAVYGIEARSNSRNKSQNQSLFRQSFKEFDQSHTHSRERVLNISTMQSNRLSNAQVLNMSSTTTFLAHSSPEAEHRPSISSQPMSPVEIAQVLEIPFATNIISGEQGDKLSTLV